LNLDTSSGEDVQWNASFNRQTLRCTTEELIWNGRRILNVKDGSYQIWSIKWEQYSKCPIVYRRSRVLVVGVESILAVGISDGYFRPR
jgi:hypothetical protein